MKSIAEPIKKAPCLKCHGYGRITYVRDTPDGPEQAVKDCERCHGMGVINVEVKH